MTNYEKFKSRIITLFSRGMTLAVIDGDPCCCRDNSGVIPDAICECCDLYGIGSCEEARIKWLYADYVEPPKLTKAERAFCESLYSDTNISRKPNGYLSLDKGFSHVYIATEFYNIKFKFITCDGAFWKVEDLLKLEVIDNDN